MRRVEQLALKREAAKRAKAGKSPRVERPQPPRPKTPAEMTIVELLKRDIARIPRIPKFPTARLSITVPTLKPTKVRELRDRALDILNRWRRVREVAKQCIDQPPQFAWGFVTGACLADGSQIWGAAVLYGWWHGRESQQGVSRRWYDPPLDHIVFHCGIALGWINREPALAWALGQIARVQQAIQ